MFIKSLIIKSNEGLIRKIDFHQGLNLIVDETPEHNTETGNNVGKTTILRLIDICLGKKANSIYVSPEDRRTVNEEIKTFLVEKEVVVTLVLVSKWTENAREIRIRRNFLLRKSALYEINGKTFPNEKEFTKELERSTFGIETVKPTYRQLIAHNIRYSNAAISQTLRCLEGLNTAATYESLFLYMLGCNYEGYDERQKSLEDLNTEEIFRKKLQKEKSRNTLASELGIVKSEIDELEKQKEQVCLNPEFDDEMSELSDLKYRITSLSAQLSSLKLRYSIMEEAKEEILSKKSDVDVATLKAIYKQAQRFVPDLHHTFEQLLEYHNSMLVRKADFIADELPTIENQIVKLEARIDELHKSEKVLSQKLTQSVSYVDYENLVTELTQKYERMGSLKQQIEQIDKVEERIERLKQKLADINGVLFTEEFKGKVQKQLDKLNFYLSRISQRLYGEQYGMVFEIQAAKNRTSEIFRFDVKRLDADTVNFSSGKKQGEIVCFDMAYILFADQEKIPCFHFGLYDKKELLHSNQLLKISTLLEENVNLQFVASILSDKLPKGLKNDRYIIVKLSQKDKLFKF